MTECLHGGSYRGLAWFRLDRVPTGDMAELEQARGVLPDGDGAGRHGRGAPPPACGQTRRDGDELSALTRTAARDVEKAHPEQGRDAPVFDVGPDPGLRQPGTLGVPALVLIDGLTPLKDPPSL